MQSYQSRSTGQERALFVDYSNFHTKPWMMMMKEQNFAAKRRKKKFFTFCHFGQQNAVDNDGQSRIKWEKIKEAESWWEQHSDDLSKKGIGENRLKSH